MSSSSKTNAKCVFCENGPHSRDCKKYATLEDRKDRLTKLGCCYKCIAAGHTASKCKSNLTCRNCNQPDHVAPVCPVLIEKMKKGADMPKQKNAQDKTGTFLKTFVAKVLANSRETLIRGILDGGSDLSYIQEDVLHQLGVEINPNAVLNLQQFGTTKCTVSSTELVTVAIGNLRGYQRICSLYTTKCVTGPTRLGPPSWTALDVLPHNLQYANPDLFLETQ